MLTRFWKDRQAGVAPLLGIALIPLMAVVGTAVCYTQANVARTAFQAVLDITIQVNTGGDPTSTLLQNCASSLDKFYLLTSAS
jgi:Flp pilus assembly protein TadG